MPLRLLQLHGAAATRHGREDVMLAGNLKLKTFVMLVALVGVLGSAGLYLACRGGGDKPQDASDKAKHTIAEERPAPPAPTPIDAAAAAPAPADAGAPAAQAGDLAVRPYD